jgi:myo-inositol-1(or 4)-monophosphatase
MSAPAMPELPDILALARRAALAAGAVLTTAWRQAAGQVTARTAYDVKMNVDVEAETAILAILRAARPQDAILSEESAASGPAAAGQWIVDPLDGTVNFSHGHPYFCTSIAWSGQGQVQVGVVHDPLRGETFAAARGLGATCNDVPLRVSATAQPSHAMVVIGYGKDDPERHALVDMGRLCGKVQKVRICGSAALDLCYVASGRFDAYYEGRIHLWDIAAALLVLEEAGGRTWRRPLTEPWRCQCLGTTPLLESAMKRLLLPDLAPGPQP